MDNYQFMLRLCQGAILVFTILAAFSTWGVTYYNRKIKESEKTAPITNDTTKTIYNIKGDLVQGDKRTEYNSTKENLADFEKILDDRLNKFKKNAPDPDNPYNIPKEHRNEVELKFQFHSGQQDLGFLYATVNITKLTNGKKDTIGSYNIIAKESPIYLPIGSYIFEFTAREYQTKVIDFGVSQESIFTRLSLDINLEKK